MAAWIKTLLLSFIKELGLSPGRDFDLTATLPMTQNAFAERWQFHTT